MSVMDTLCRQAPNVYAHILTSHRRRRLSERAAWLWETLSLYEASDLELLRFGSAGDGGYVLLEDYSVASSLVSLGVGDNNDVEFNFAELGKPVYCFDHTISELTRPHPNIHFFRLGVGQGRSLKPFAELLQLVQEEYDQVLMCDVEGAERATNFLNEVDLTRFRQITIEVHGLIRSAWGNRWQQTQDLLGTLVKDHAVVHLHVNNYRPVLETSGGILPDVLEITLASRANYELWRKSGTTSFPSSLDAPNAPFRPDPAWTLPHSGANC